MLVGDLFILLGPPMSERLIVRVQTKSSLPVLTIMRLGCGLIPHSYKTFMITETVKTNTASTPPPPSPVWCYKDDDDDDDEKGISHCSEPKRGITECHMPIQTWWMAIWYVTLAKK